MKKTKKDKLKAAGWKVGSTSEFLDLSPDEEAMIEIRHVLANYLREWRTRKNLTQMQLAKAVKSSQSRVAKMEAGDPSVSIDLLLRCLLYLGASPKQVARAIASAA